MLLMTASAASSDVTSDAGPFTAMHFVLLAMLVVIVIAAIAWGARQKRIRNDAARERIARSETLSAHPQTQTAVSPAPPPLGDSGMTVGTAIAPAKAEQPAPNTTSAPVMPAPSNYSLNDVKGLGPKAVPLLAEQGVGDLAALAALDPARAAEIDAGLGALAGRMARDQWVEQAKLLTAGDVTTFETAYGKL